jgi:hypothetical protein
VSTKSLNFSPDQLCWPRRQTSLGSAAKTTIPEACRTIFGANMMSPSVGGGYRKNGLTIGRFMLGVKREKTARPRNSGTQFLYLNGNLFSRAGLLGV